jgi:outer membrane protein
MIRMNWKVVGLAMLLAASAAYADDTRIGYVDMRKVLNETKAGKRAKEDIEKLVKQRQGGLDKEQQQLKSMQEKFEKEQLLLSDAQKQAKQREFETKVRAFQQSTQDAERDVQQKQAEYTRKAIPEIRAVIRDVAKEEKLTLVFEKNEMPVLYAVDGPDLTAKVIQRVDAKSGG